MNKGIYLDYETPRKDWKKVIDEVFFQSIQQDFVITILSNSSNGKDNQIVNMANHDFSHSMKKEILNYITKISDNHFEQIVEFIENNHNPQNIYQIKDRAIARKMNIPIKSYMFEIKSSVFDGVRLLIIFRKTNKYAQFEGLVKKIKSQILPKKWKLFRA